MDLDDILAAIGFSITPTIRIDSGMSMSSIAAHINTVTGNMDSCDRVRIQWPAGVDVHGAPNEIYVGNIATTVSMALGGDTPAGQVEFYNQLSRELADMTTIVTPLTPRQCEIPSHNR